MVQTRSMTRAAAVAAANTGAVPAKRENQLSFLDTLSNFEKKCKPARELCTIFFSTKNKGLTDIEIYEEGRKRGFTGYNGITPDCIARSYIYRWNDVAVTSVTGGLKCSHSNCKTIATFGRKKNKPTKCKRHKTSTMSKVVEVRLIREPRRLVGVKRSQTKWYLDKTFANRLFKN